MHTDRCYFRRMSVLVLIVILLGVVFAAWSWLRRHHRSPPIYPGALPLIGHSLKILVDHKHFWNLIQEIGRYTLETGGVTEFRIGFHSVYVPEITSTILGDPGYLSPLLTVQTNTSTYTALDGRVLTDPEDSLTVSSSCLSKPYFYDFAKEFVNNGLVTAEAHIWKTHRKLLNPAFNQQVLNTYIKEINVQARNLVSQLASEVGKEPFDARKYFINYTLSTVTRTSLKLNIEDQITICTDYAKAFEDLLALYCDRGHRVWLHLSYIFNWSAMKRKQTQLQKTLNDIINPIIHKRKLELKVNKGLNIDNDSTQGKFKPILDHMLHLADEQNAFTDDDIREHLDTFVAASYDTTSSTMTIILSVIGKHQDVQEKIFNELQEVLENKDEDFTKDDLQKLVYLEAVIKESMRLYSVIPFTARKVDRDVELKNYTLRSGSSCVILLYGLLRHPLWGADADQFRPERWLDPITLPDHPSLHAAFGVGKRNCIGKLFGITMMKTALAHICRQYLVTGDIDQVVWEYQFILKPVEGHYIGLTLRK